MNLNADPTKRSERIEIEESFGIKIVFEPVKFLHGVDDYLMALINISNAVLPLCLLHSVTMENVVSLLAESRKLAFFSARCRCTEPILLIKLQPYTGAIQT